MLPVERWSNAEMQKKDSKSFNSKETRKDDCALPIYVLLICASCFPWFPWTSVFKKTLCISAPPTTCWPTTWRRTGAWRSTTPTSRRSSWAACRPPSVQPSCRWTRSAPVARRFAAGALWTSRWRWSTDSPQKETVRHPRKYFLIHHNQSSSSSTVHLSHQSARLYST